MGQRTVMRRQEAWSGACMIYQRARRPNLCWQNEHEQHDASGVRRHHSRVAGWL